MRTSLSRCNCFRASVCLVAVLAVAFTLWMTTESLAWGSGQESGSAGGVGRGLKASSATGTEKSPVATNPLLHVDTVSDLSSGISVVGVGKGGLGSPRSDGAEVSPGFEYCRLGTGYDGDWNIVGERYVYGPSESAIHLGGHYTYLYSDRWCGDGWYRPNGSQYYENQNHFHIPHPGDYGYDYWEWYNVVFSYDPMPSSMKSEEGQWSARWYDNSSNVCTKNYTVMYILSDHKMCGVVSGNDPSDIRSVFNNDDSRCYSWLRLDNFTLNWTTDIKWRWFSPEGFYTEAEHDATDPGAGSWWEWYKAWCYIAIASDYPSTHPGSWHVDVYVKDHSGSYEYKYTEYFTITCPNPLTPPSHIGPSDGSDCQAASVTCDWTDVSGAVSYELRIGQTCGSGSSYQTSGSSYTVGSLEAGTTYYWQVHVKDDCEQWGAWSSCWSFTAAPGLLPSPSLASPANGAVCQNASGTLDWSDVGGAAGYMVQVGTSCGSGSEYEVASSHYSYSGLSSGETYWWRVRTKNSCSQYGSYSDCWSFAVSPGPLLPPFPITPPVGAVDVPVSGSLDWSDVAGAAGYRVQLGTSCGSGSEYEVVPSGCSYSGLIPSTMYYWRVSTMNSCGEYEPYTSCWTFTTESGAVPAAPTGCVASDDDCSRVHLTWMDNSGDEDGFRVYRNDDQIASVGVNATSYDDPTGNPNDTYSYCVVAYNTNGESESCCESGTRLGVPPTPTGLSASDGQPCPVLLMWNDVTGEDGYRIRRGGIEIGTVEANVTTFDDPAATPGVTYEYCVTAFNACGASGGECDSGGCGDVAPKQFIRGDDDGDGELNISDPILSLCAQFGSGCELPCLDASDVDDDGEITISDPIRNLCLQFADCDMPPLPFPGCGPDPSPDELDCFCHAYCMGCGGPLAQSDARVRIWLGGPVKAGLRKVAYPVYLENSEALLGYESTVSFPTGMLAYEGVTRGPGEGQADEFFSAAERAARRGVVRLGNVVSLDLSTSLEQGVHEVGRLVFRQVGQSKGTMNGPELVSGKFVSVGMAVGEASIVESPHQIEAGAAGVESFMVSAAPNPTGGSTSIRYGVPVAGSVEVVIFNTAGQVVRSLGGGEVEAGMHEVVWDGCNARGEAVPNGIYFCRISTSERTEMRKVVIVR